MSYALLTVVSRLFTGRLFDQRGANFVLYPTFPLFAAALLLLAFASSGWQVVLSGALVGLGYGTFVSCAQTVAIQEADPGHLGLATSTFFFCMDLANGLGSSLLGALAAAAGYRALYLVMAAVALASAAMYYVVHGRRAA